MTPEQADSLQRIVEFGELQTALEKIEQLRMQLAEAERVIKDALYDWPLVECQDFHHRKADRNHPFSECGPAQRWEAVRERMAAFAAHGSATVACTCGTVSSQMRIGGHDVNCPRHGMLP